MNHSQLLFKMSNFELQRKFPTLGWKASCIQLVVTIKIRDTKYQNENKVKCHVQVNLFKHVIHSPGPVEEQVSHAQEHLQLVEPPKHIERSVQ